MTIEQYPSGDGDDERERRLLQELQIDPVIDELLETAWYTRGTWLENREEVDLETIYEDLRSINNALGKQGWVGKPVTVTGRLGIMSQLHYDHDQYPVPYATKKDKNGNDYYEVEDERFIAFEIDTANGPEGEVSVDETLRVGLALVPIAAFDPEEKDSMSYIDQTFILCQQGAVEDSDGGHGALSVIYDDPSAKMIAIHMKLGPSDLREAVCEADNATVSDRALTRYLKRVKIRRHYEEMGVGYPTAGNFGKLIHDKLKLEGENFEIGIGGPVQVVTDWKEEDEGEGGHFEVETVQMENAKIKGQIRSIIMESSPDSDELRPSLLVDVESHEPGLRHGMVIPAGSLENLRNTRPKRALLGERAVAFSEGDDTIADCFSAMVAKASNPELERELTAFQSILAQLNNTTLQREVVFDRSEGHFLVSVDEDILAIIEKYSELIARHDPDKPLTTEVLRAIVEELRQETANLPGLKVGDRMQISGMPAMTESGSMVPGGLTLTGTYKRLAIQRLNDRVTEKESIIIDQNLVLVLDYTISLTDHGRVYEGEVPIVLVADNSDKNIKFAKIEPKLEEE